MQAKLIASVLLASKSYQGLQKVSALPAPPSCFLCLKEAQRATFTLVNLSFIPFVLLSPNQVHRAQDMVTY